MTSALIADTFDPTETAEAPDTDTLFTRAVTHLRSGEYAEAVTLLDQVLAVEPDCAPAHAYVGLAHFHLRDVDSAKTHLDRAVEVDPEEFLSWAKRGELWFRMACYPQAVSDFRQALKLDAPNTSSRKLVAKMLEEAHIRSRTSFNRVFVLPRVPNVKAWAGYVQALMRGTAGTVKTVEARG
jgi:tetratricopeptide (TPR) repeat protein